MNKSHGQCDVGSLSSELSEALSVTLVSNVSSSEVSESDEESLEESNNLKKDIQVELKDWLQSSKHFLVLSSAGKPIFSYPHTSSEELVVGYMGVIQTVMGFYQDQNDTLMSFNSRGMRFVIKVEAEGNVYLVAISKIGSDSCALESASQLRGQLDILYTQILSAATLQRVLKAFSAGGNFDLRRLLHGSEKFLDSLCSDIFKGDLSILLGAIQVLRMRLTFRNKLNRILLRVLDSPNNEHSENHHKVSDFLLYGILASDKHLVTVLRPKQHSLYPTDLRLLMNTVYSTSFLPVVDETLSSSAEAAEEFGEYWFPLCLPKFNASGYLHVYVQFLTPAPSSIAIILVSADKDAFAALQSMATRMKVDFRKNGGALLSRIIQAQENRVTCTELGLLSSVKHFMYKSRHRVQYFSPASPTELRDKKRLYELYLALQSSSQLHKIQVQYSTSRPRSLGRLVGISWVTEAFEIYVIAGEQIGVPALVGSANAILAYAKKEEQRIFLGDGAVF